MAKKIASLLLMILFLAIPFAQALHKSHINDFFNKNGVEKVIIFGVAEKCFICDYAAQIKNKPILMAHPPAINAPIKACETLNAFVYARIYKFTLQNLSNKGPPCFL